MTSASRSKKHYTDMLGFLGDIGPPMFDDVTLANVRSSNVDLIHMTTAWPFMDWTDTLKMHRDFVAQITARQEAFRLVKSAKDLIEAREKKKIGIILGLQDPEFIGEQFERLTRLFEEGIRVIQIAYQRQGPYGNGFLVDDGDEGLTAKGREFVKAVNDVGLILDLSHSAPLTALEGLRRSTGPTMISHTCCRSVYDHPRGINAELIGELAQHENVIVGILAMTFFLAEADDSLKPIIRQICHLAERIGPDRVVIGTDAPVGGFTDLQAAEKMFRETTQEMMDPQGDLKSRWPTHIHEVAADPQGFQRLGQALTPFFTDSEIDGILGQNARLFFQQHLPQE